MNRQLFYLFFLMGMLVFSSIAIAEETCTETYGNGMNKFSLATGSPGELGLVKALAEGFMSQAKDITLCWIKAASGESLKMLKQKSVDMIMVHDPAGEKKAAEEGWAVQKTLIGSNEFFIVGPCSDPVKIAEAKNAVEAYTLISKAQAKFFSRGDNSGTHKKEMAIWEKAGITPSGEWYVVTKDFMQATLKRANDENGYFMTDSSTWVAEKKNLPNLKILFKGDKFLVNTYHALRQPDGASSGVTLASKFIEFVASEAGQRIIRDYGKQEYGEGIYNDAFYAKQYE
jgi:tungstate transport system substrate-binding protein